MGIRCSFQSLHSRITFCEWQDHQCPIRGRRSIGGIYRQCSWKVFWLLTGSNQRAISPLLSSPFARSQVSMHPGPAPDTWMRYSIVFKADEEVDCSISHGDSQMASKHLFQQAIGAAVEVFRGHHMISRPEQRENRIYVCQPIGKG